MDLFSADDVGGGGGGGSSGRAETRMMGVPRAKRLDWDCPKTPVVRLSTQRAGRISGLPCIFSGAEVHDGMDAAWGFPWHNFTKPTYVRYYLSRLRSR
jgi:hypothetical protein